MREIVIPFFREYSLKSSKLNDFNKFSQILTMIENREHLATSGLRRISEIVQTMNRKKQALYLKSSEAIR